MQIIHDHSHVSRTEKEFIARGYARESFYSLRFSYDYTEAQKAENRACADEAGTDSDAWNARVTSSARQRSGHMERIAALLARNFRIYQYDKDEAVPYESDWDLFFWCNGFETTMQGLLSGRDYSCFTLSFNSQHGHERRQKVHDRAMRILDLFADAANLEVAVQYAAIMDDDRIKRDAALAIPAIAGRTCTYGGMEGRLETNGEHL